MSVTSEVCGTLVFLAFPFVFVGVVVSYENILDYGNAYLKSKTAQYKEKIK